MSLLLILPSGSFLSTGTVGLAQGDLVMRSIYFCSVNASSFACIRGNISGGYDLAAQRIVSGSEGRNSM